MFYNLFANVLNGIRTFTNDAVNYLKCRSMCCNNINIYNPKSCCVQGEIWNKWVRASTPSVESPLNNSQKFYTPKNK